LPFPLSSDGCNLLSISTGHYFRSAADSPLHGYGLHTIGPVTRAFSGRDKRADFLTPQFIVTEPGVHLLRLPDFSVSLPDKAWEGF
jgi:hypothetical protein